MKEDINSCLQSQEETQKSEASNGIDNQRLLQAADYEFRTEKQNNQIVSVVKKIRNIKECHLIIPQYDDQGRPIVAIAENACQYVGEQLTSLTIPKGITRIGGRAFYSCSALSQVNLPDGLQRIDEFAFCRTLLIGVTVPQSVTMIGCGAFACSSLTELIVDSTNSHYHSRDNCIINTSNNQLVCGCKNSVIPPYVKSIYLHAFANSKELTAITIPEGVTQIGNYAFTNCADLKTVVMPNSVVSIDEGAFYECVNLTSINIPEGVTSIGDFAFENCLALEEITLPRSLTSVGGGMFQLCNNLKTINFSGTKHQWKKIRSTDYYYDHHMGDSQYALPATSKINCRNGTTGLRGNNSLAKFFSYLIILPIGVVTLLINAVRELFGKLKKKKKKG